MLAYFEAGFFPVPTDESVRIMSGARVIKNKKKKGPYGATFFLFILLLTRAIFKLTFFTVGSTLVRLNPQPNRRHRMKIPFAWNDTNTAEMFYRRKQGWSCAWIAKLIGTTKNSVIGRKTREDPLKFPVGLRNLDLYPNSDTPPRPRKERAPPRPRKEKPKAPPRPEKPKSPAPPRFLELAMMPKAPPRPSKTAVQILDLLPIHCRWPLDKGERVSWYCGVTKTRGSYCETHACLAYTGNKRALGLTPRQEVRFPTRGHGRV